MGEIVMKIIPKQLVTLASVGAFATACLFASVAPNQNSAALHHGFVGEIESVLSMTPQQKDQARTTMQNARQSATPIRQELTSTNQALQAAVRSDDTAQIQRLSTTEGQEIGQLLAIRSSAVANVYKTLSPNQKTRADALQHILMRSANQRMTRTRSQAGS